MLGLQVDCVGAKAAIEKKALALRHGLQQQIAAAWVAANTATMTR